MSNVLVVVGGHSGNVGKTSVIAGLIEALPEMEWTAVRVAPNVPARALPENQVFVLHREEVANSRTETGRFLAAGARRSYTLLSAREQFSQTASVVNSLLESSTNAIFESNEVIGLVRPELCLGVLNLCVNEWDEASLPFLQRADAFVVYGEQDGRCLPAELKAAQWFQEKPRFTVSCQNRVCSSLVRYVTARIPPTTAFPV